MTSISGLPGNEQEDVDLTGEQQLDESGATLGESPACMSCRKKKARCSREQPCSQCVKSDVECVYDDKRAKGGIKTGVIERLAQRLDTIENMFLGQGMLLQQLINVRDSDLTTSKSKDQPSTSFADHTDRVKRSLCTLGMDTKGLDVTQTLPSISTPLSKRKRNTELWTSSKRTSQASKAPKTLPLPPSKVLEVILETYFKIVHPWIPIIHPSTLMQRARQSPRSTAAELLLNAIVAVAAQYIDDEVDTDTKSRSVEYRQTVITAAIESTSLEVLQALLLISFDTIKRGTSQSPWSLVALACRKAEELQLNSEHVSEKESTSNYFLSVPPYVEVATAWIEVEERRRVFWGSFLLDRFCSIVTGVSPIISSKSISRRLPCDGCMWELDHAVETSFFKIHQQTQQEEAATGGQNSLFPPAYSTPKGPSGVGGLAYTIEATESLHLVSKFHASFSLEINTSHQLSSWLNKFRQLDSKLLQWELCLTHRWREVRVVNGYIDPNLTLAHMTHNAAIIILHERLAHPPPQSQEWLSTLVSAASKEACMMAAIKMNQIARRYLDASNDVPPHQFMYNLYVAGQFLLAEATRQGGAPLEELRHIIAALRDVSFRIEVVTPSTSDMSSPLASPATRFANSLVEQRNLLSAKAFTTNNGIGDGTRTSTTVLQDTQLPPHLIDVPTMLQQYAASTSSGISCSRLPLLEQTSASALVDDNVLALTQSLMPNNKVARNISVYHELCNSLNGQDDQTFDFIAELRNMGSRTLENVHEERGGAQQGDVNDVDSHLL